MRQRAIGAMAALRANHLRHYGPARAAVSGEVCGGAANATHSVCSLPRLRGRGGEGASSLEVLTHTPTLALPRKRGREPTAFAASGGEGAGSLES